MMDDDQRKWLVKQARELTVQFEAEEKLILAAVVVCLDKIADRLAEIGGELADINMSLEDITLRLGKNDDD